MRKLILTVFAVVTVMFSLTCYASLPDEAFSAEDLTLGQSFSDAMEKYGIPVDSRTQNDKSVVHNLRTPNGVIGVRTSDNGIISGLYINTPGCKTTAGIKIGSSIEEVKKAYGQPTLIGKDYYSKKGSVLDILTYNKPMPQRRLKQFSFQIENNKVTNIRITEGYAS